jgi:hypothetical protein
VDRDAFFGLHLNHSIYNQVAYLVRVVHIHRGDQVDTMRIVGRLRQLKRGIGIPLRDDAL